MMAKRKQYTLGEVHVNKWLGNRITEVLGPDKKRLGWIWTHSDGRVVVSPHLGLYIWFNEEGDQWTQESAAMWLVKARGS